MSIDAELVRRCGRNENLGADVAEWMNEAHGWPKVKPLACGVWCVGGPSSPCASLLSGDLYGKLPNSVLSTGATALKFV